MHYYDSPDDDRIATPQEACREYALAVAQDLAAMGCEQPAWILTNLDSWEPNPLYTGPARRHPEDDSELDAAESASTGPFHSICEQCGELVESIIGCPDGAEICQACFDAGHH